MKQISLDRRGVNGALEGSDNTQVIETPPHSTLICNSLGVFRSVPYWTKRDVFDLLPAAAAAAGSDDMLLSLGTGTEVIARAAKGGVNVKTQASTPADNDNVMLKPVASSSFIVPITAVSKPRIMTRVNLTQITELFFSAGLDENLTSPDPQATAGDGAKFYFDPAGENSTGLAAGTRTNWILTHKIAGVDTFVDSGIVVLAGVDYELGIQWGEDLKPAYYINGVLVYTGLVANTSGASVGVLIGEQVNANPPASQKDFDCRYVSVERFIG